MRQRNVKNCDEILQNSDKYVKDINELKELIRENKYENIFLEIGIGKGAFISECARRHKENLYIGIELNKGVVSLATKKIARFEEEIGEKLDNLRVLDYNALELENIFEEGQVDKIYLNFSDPWPKNKHEKRRLTSDEFCTRLIMEKHIAVVPGTAFGECGEGFVRVSYSYSLNHLKLALERIGEFLEELNNGN